MENFNKNLKKLAKENLENPIARGKKDGFVSALEKQGVAYMNVKGNGNLQITNAYLLDDDVLIALSYPLKSGEKIPKRTEGGKEVRIQINKKGWERFCEALLKDKTDEEKIEICRKAINLAISPRVFNKETKIVIEK